MHEPSTPLSILIVEDDHSVATMYSTALRRNGYAVRVAGDGCSGLREALREPPDLLLLDLHLPCLEGHAVLELLRQRSGTRSLPVAVLSNHDSSEARLRSRQLGVLAHLVKCETTPGALSSLVGDWCRSGFAVAP